MHIVLTHISAATRHVIFQLQTSNLKLPTYTPHIHLLVMDDPAPPKKLRAATQENRKRIDSIIRDYLNNWAHETHDLVLGNVTPHDLSHFQRALKGRLGDKLYYEYDAEGGILTLKSSNSSPFTVAIQEVLSSCFLKIGAAHPDENRIEFYRKVHHLPPRAGSRDYSLKVADASTDEDIKEVNCMQDLLPNVVLEVAFTQSYESVVEDARQWLVKSLGAVRLAIVVKFKEGAINNPGPGLGVASGSSNQGPVKPLRSQASPGSSRAVVPEEWVGPIVGFMEIWRYDSESSSIFIDHPRVVGLNPFLAVPQFRLTL